MRTLRHIYWQQQQQQLSLNPTLRLGLLLCSVDLPRFRLSNNLSPQKYVLVMVMLARGPKRKSRNMLRCLTFTTQSSVLRAAPTVLMTAPATERHVTGPGIVATLTPFLRLGTVQSAYRSSRMIEAIELKHKHGITCGFGGKKNQHWFRSNDTMHITATATYKSKIQLFFRRHNRIFVPELQYSFFP